MVHTLQHDKLWQTVLGDIEISLSRANYVTWFKNTHLIEQTDGKLVIGVPNVFIKQQLERKYNDLVLSTVQKNGVEIRDVEYKIHTASPKVTEPELAISSPTTTPSPQTPSSASTPRPTSPLTHQYRQGLNEKYEFESFIVGSGNELAHAACQAVAAQPGTKYNPLFLYGGVGIGKTHLIQAVGNEVLRNRPDAKVVYISSEQFVQEFVDALRFKKNTDFADYYRSADVLIIDDVQFFAGKEKIQEEFFHTFNALHQANKQI
ncbi:ATP-binding protein, partial [Candidatus Saccharibacteria bacterium]|nr:ATP-binding protein [Candidatus Saccharibacteria bacterium]